MIAVKSLVVKILFGPWFFILGLRDKVADSFSRFFSARAPLVMLFLLLFLLVILLFVHRKTHVHIKTKLDDIFFGFAYIGILGGFANVVVSLANGKMPVIAESYFEILLSKDDPLHVYVMADDPNLRFRWLADWISAENSSFVKFLFPCEPGYITMVSPGDLMMAFAFNFLWLLVLFCLCKIIFNYGQKILKNALA